MAQNLGRILPARSFWRRASTRNFYSAQNHNVTRQIGAIGGVEMANYHWGEKNAHERDGEMPHWKPESSLNETDSLVPVNSTNQFNSRSAPYRNYTMRLSGNKGARHGGEHDHQ
eukprot:TRINITY_DN232_c0_g1_i1.p1 TRINITY_DN232_c0_g1~~TRINITY_DN232_c0_g1_i1.p1  ORF type:complete len:114 (-),score=19.98 TRINITY_DN232_c0_g1_i1:93-434(-)